MANHQESDSTKNHDRTKEIQAYKELGLTQREDILYLIRKGVGTNLVKAYQEQGIQNCEDMVRLHHSGVSPNEVKAFQDEAVEELGDMVYLALEGVRPKEAIDHLYASRFSTPGFLRSHSGL